ncbi:MAG: protein-L-isoaspartate(D-aspartate) O-methyltransferase [Magnetococcales bacterium]|nr:protein-L-isoaspartate(D-aspartate) O-methyltransferase [Magnetococcales bacterium]
MLPIPALDPQATRALRQRMVMQQLVPREIRDPRVLLAMARVPRECFVPAHLADHAYDDSPLPIGAGQTISQPYMVAVMAELLSLTGTETVLEIGAGSGYSAAILAQLAQRVVTVERIPELLEQARRVWQALGLTNIEGMVGDGTLGAPERAPFAAISVTAGAPPEPPPSLIDQLLPGVGRMVIPAGSRGLQTLYLVHRDAEGQVSREGKLACIFVPLLGAEGWQEEFWGLIHPFFRTNT